MKNLLKDKKVLIGLLVLAGGVGYYFYDKNRKEKVKAQAQTMAGTPFKAQPSHLNAPRADVSSAIQVETLETHPKRS